MFGNDGSFVLKADLQQYTSFAAMPDLLFFLLLSLHQLVIRIKWWPYRTLSPSASHRAALGFSLSILISCRDPLCHIRMLRLTKSGHCQHRMDGTKELCWPNPLVGFVGPNTSLSLNSATIDHTGRNLKSETTTETVAWLHSSFSRRR